MPLGMIVILDNSNDIPQVEKLVRDFKENFLLVDEGYDGQDIFEMAMLLRR